MMIQRKAFSMITAIFLILMMSSVAIFIMNLSGKMVQSTTAQYQKEQAVLYAKSYTEYAIMTVMSNDRNGAGLDCIDTINGTIVNDPANPVYDYTITTSISYIGLAGTIANCNTQLGNPAVNDELNIIVDVYVNYRDINDPRAGAAEPLTYHRRTLQKI